MLLIHTRVYPVTENERKHAETVLNGAGPRLMLGPVATAPGSDTSLGRLLAPQNIPFLFGESGGACMPTSHNSAI